MTTRSQPETAAARRSLRSTISLCAAVVLAVTVIAGSAAAQTFESCTITGTQMSVGSVNAGVVGNLNRSDFIPDFVVADTDADVVALVVIDPIALRRIDCGRATTVSTLTENGPRDLDVLFDNNDLNLDIAVASLNRAAVFFGDGLGGAADAGRQIAGLDASAIVAADLDGDGNSELVIGTINDNTVEIVAPGANSPSFVPLDVGNAVDSLAVADMDGDSRPDVVVLDQGGRLQLFRQNPNPPPTPTGTPAPPDLFLPGQVLFSDDDLQLAAFAVADPDNGGLGIDSGDVPDLVLVGQRASGEVSVLIGDRNPTNGYDADFGGAYDAGMAPTDVALGDLDGDGQLDVMVTDGVGNRLYLYESDALGELTGRGDLATGGAPSVLMVADFDADTELDVAVGNQSDGSVTMFLSNNLAVPTFTPTVTLTVTLSPTISPTVTPTFTPTETPTQTPTSSAAPTRTSTPTITTTPGFFEVRGESCVAIAPATSGGAWPLLLGIFCLLASKKRGARS